jgi:hypothetical protein
MERATTEHRTGNASAAVNGATGVGPMPTLSARNTPQGRELIEPTRPANAIGSTDTLVHATWTQQQLLARAPLLNDWDEV